MTINVGINGMGRIGRMVIRAIIESKNKDIKIKHINNRSNSEASCTLIKYDSVHGKFNADVDYDENHLICAHSASTRSGQTTWPERDEKNLKGTKPERVPMGAPKWLRIAQDPIGS